MFDCRIEWTGSEQCQRYIINRGDDHYWTGEDWSSNFGLARRYENHGAACRVYGQLVEEFFRNKPARKFEVMTKVVVFGNEDFTLDELKEYLSKVCTLVMVPSIRGLGPAEESLAQVVLSWDELRETGDRKPVVAKGK